MSVKSWLLSITLLLVSLQTWAEVKVVASIKPLQLIASSVLDEVAEVEVLIPPGASPHHYSMKPSDIRKLSDADVVFWVGPDLEQFLAKALENTQAQKVTWLPEEHTDSEDAHEEHGKHEKHSDHDEHKGHDEHAGHNEHKGHDDHDEHEGHDHHDHGDVDPHLWMNPMKSLEAAQQLVAAVSAKHPELKDKLDANLRKFAGQLITLDRKLMTQLDAVKHLGFYAFHDAYGPFVERYQVNQLGYFTVDPGRPIGTRHLAEIRESLQKNEAVCVFGEPQFKAKVVRAVTDDLPVRYSVLDPLAIEFKPSATGYSDYLQWLADQLTNCLKG